MVVKRERAENSALALKAATALVSQKDREVGLLERPLLQLRQR